MSKIKIGITVGDINGVGLEVIIKTLEDKRILELCTPIIYGSSKVISYHKNIVNQDDFITTIADARTDFGGLETRSQSFRSLFVVVKVKERIKLTLVQT